MKRNLRALLVFGVFAVSCFAQGKQGEGAGNLAGWNWANFLLLALGLGYLIAKSGVPFLTARGEGITKDLAESERARKDAEARAAEVERRLANLEQEVAALRAESQQEVCAEKDRAAARTVAEIAKVQSNAEQEIVAAGKAARMDLKRYTAELAIGLAEKKIRARMTPVTQDALVQGFVRDLK